MKQNDTLTNEQLAVLLDSLFHQNKVILEKLDAIQHTICDNDDVKTKQAIGNYLSSGFRNGKVYMSEKKHC